MSTANRNFENRQGPAVRTHLASPAVAVAAALAQVDKVLDREREIKRAQISLLIRIKNQLSVAQQNKLIELRRKPS